MSRLAAVSVERSTVSVNGTNVPFCAFRKSLRHWMEKSEDARPLIAASARLTSASPSLRCASSNRSEAWRSPRFWTGLCSGAASTPATAQTSVHAATAVRRLDRFRPVFDANRCVVRRMYLINPLDHRRPPHSSQSARRAVKRAPARGHARVTRLATHAYSPVGAPHGRADCWRPGGIISGLMARVPKLLDVSVPLAAGMPAYPGNPEFELQPVKRIATGGSSNVSRLVMGTHTGTHVDAPRHFFDDGDRRRRAAARSAARPRARRRYPQARRHRRRTSSPRPACAKTSACCSRRRTPRCGTANGFHQDYTYLTEAGARYLVDQGVKVDRHRLPVGRAVQESGRTGAPRAALAGRGHHRRAEPLRSRTGHVRDVLPASARRRRRRRSRARRPEALRGRTCWTMCSSWCWPEASASASIR